MTKVGEHITLDIIGTTKEYDPAVFEKVILMALSRIMAKSGNKPVHQNTKETDR